MTDKYTANDILSIEQKALNESRDQTNNNWYDRVYWCYEQTPHSTGPIQFNCSRCNSFQNAEILALSFTSIAPTAISARQTMLPICRWVPTVFDPYILNWKLKNTYWGGNTVM